MTRLERRPELETDEPFLRALYAGIHGAELARSGWTAEALDELLSMQSVVQRTRFRTTYPDARFLVLTVHDRPVGRLYLVHEETDDLVIDISLLPEIRGFGHGTALMQEVIGDAAALGRGVRLTVGRDNPAQRLYGRLGFVVVADDGVNRRMHRPPDPST